MKCIRDHYFLLLSFLFGLTMVSSADAQWDSILRQQHPELFVTIQDSITVYLVAGTGDTINAHEVHAAYVFDMLYDSTSIVMYTFTECMKNGNRIKLAKWISDRTVNANAALLSFNSTTDTFRCHTGDTLSFYREVRWSNPSTGWSDTNSYRALDSLDYAVELVRQSDSTRVALLDSIGMLSSPTPSRPVVHGMHPLLAVVPYVVPSSLNNVKTFIRVLVYHRGSGEYWFTRHDWFNIALSARLQDSIWNQFIKLFSSGNPKIIIGDNERNVMTGSGSDRITLTNAGSSRDIQITFKGTAGNEGTAVVVYNALGESLFIPYMTPGSTTEGRTLYHFDQPGMYFIGLLQGNHIVALKKIIIN